MVAIPAYYWIDAAGLGAFGQYMLMDVPVEVAVVIGIFAASNLIAAVRGSTFGFVYAVVCIGAMSHSGLSAIVQPPAFLAFVVVGAIGGTLISLVSSAIWRWIATSQPVNAILHRLHIGRHSAGWAIGIMVLGALITTTFGGQSDGYHLFSITTPIWLIIYIGVSCIAANVVQKLRARGLVTRRTITLAGIVCVLALTCAVQSVRVTSIDAGSLVSPNPPPVLSSLVTSVYPPILPLCHTFSKGADLPCGNGNFFNLCTGDIWYADNQARIYGWPLPYVYYSPIDCQDTSLYPLMYVIDVLYYLLLISFILYGSYKVVRLALPAEPTQKDKLPTA